jgi:hypothetical protein
MALSGVEETHWIVQVGRYPFIWRPAAMPDHDNMATYAHSSECA